eukprot:tig00000319_g24142.t1
MQRRDPAGHLGAATLPNMAALLTLRTALAGALLRPSVSTPAHAALALPALPVLPALPAAIGEAVSEGPLSFLKNLVLMAVPKKKVSHSRSRMRSANKGLKPNFSISDCGVCGKPKQPHIYCTKPECRQPTRKLGPVISQAPPGPAAST